MRTKLKEIIIAILMLITVSQGDHAADLKLELLKKLCPVEPVREGNGHVCLVCPDFTDFAGEDYDKFMIVQIIEGSFLSGKKAKFVGYFGCEPRIRHYGGYFLLTEDERLLVDEEREYLGICRKIAGKNQDLLECRGGDTLKGRPNWWKVLCKVKEDGSLTCKKGKIKEKGK
ncbi:hypothetical protein [Thermodesulfovibrio sp.]|uniref:hypothetical protein n=1 Tax=Thermodesulfovibrio sp. TaxID=2067987 RepID=UPI0030A9DAD6